MLRSVASTPAGGAGSFSSLTITGLFTEAGEDSLTAHAGGTQAAALALSATVNNHRISVCATAGDSVKLPASTVSQVHYIRNDGAASCQVYGTGTDTINGVATATGVSLAAGAGAFFVCTTTGNWTTTTLVVSGYLEVPSNSKSAAYTTLLSDSGKSIDHPAADTNVRTFTIDSNANVPYPIGTCISFSNMTANVVTIAITTDTMYLAGTGTTGSRSLAQYGTATARKLTATTWIISGVGLT